MKSNFLLSQKSILNKDFDITPSIRFDDFDNRTTINFESKIKIKFQYFQSKVENLAFQ